MATMVYTDAFVSVNGVDLSDHVKSVSLTYEAEQLDDTVMGTTGTRSNKPGLKNWTLSCDFLQDYAAGSVDETLFPLVGADAFPVSVRAKKALPVGPTNPSYEGLAVLESYPPLTGEVGALGTASCSLRCASDLQRVTAPLIREGEAGAVAPGNGGTVTNPTPTPPSTPTPNPAPAPKPTPTPTPSPGPTPPSTPPTHGA